MTLLVISTTTQADDFFDEVDYFVDYGQENNWAYDEVFDNESGKNFIEQIALQKKKPPYEKKEFSSERFYNGVIDFYRKTKSFFSMKGIKQRSFAEVIGPDKRPANETMLWEYIIEFRDPHENLDKMEKIF